MKKNIVNQQAKDTNILKELVQSLLHIIPHSEPLATHENRSYPRYAVNWSAMLCYEGDFVWSPIYIRDISEQGVGFRHGTALKKGDATISFKVDGSDAIHLRVRLLWCEKADRGMYFSGSEFLGVATDVISPW